MKQPSLNRGAVDASNKPYSLGAHTALLIVACIVLFGAVVYFLVPQFADMTYVASQQVASTSAVASVASNTAPFPPLPQKKYIATPKPLKAIYMTQCVVGTPNFRKELVDLIDTTEINAVVIDIKDFSGGIAFPVKNPILKDGESTRCGARDMEAFIATLHDKGIYVIGRITVFQDPLYAKQHPDTAVQSHSTGGVWHDFKGLAFIDVSAKPYWDYVVAIARESHAIGFDELNFDYIRFPSDGPMSDASYTWSKGMTKPEALEHFFAYLTEHVRDTSTYAPGTPPPVLSADLFGMTTTNTDDLNIGQQLERVLPYFDYIAPMIYPSHYPNGFNGWNNPNTVPYDLIKFVLDAAVRRTIATSSVVPTLHSEKIYHAATSTASSSSATQIFTGRYSKESYSKYKIRPWLQDFDYGGNYGPKEVRAQIQATYDAGLDSWMLWAPSNRYTKEALNVE